MYGKCSYNFLDLSNNQTINQENFTLGPLAQTKTFELGANRIGSGQELYRLDLECKGIYSEACQTSGRTSYRNILITVNYDLNDAERLLKENSLNRLNDLLNKLNDWHSEINYFDKSLDELNKKIIAEDAITEKAYLKELIPNLDGFMYDLRNLWNKQDYYQLNDSIAQYSVFFSDFEQEFFRVNSSIYQNILEYNHLVDNIFLIRKMLVEMREALSLNETNFSRGPAVNDTILEFNSLLERIYKRDFLQNKKSLVEPVMIRTFELYIDFKNQSGGFSYLPIENYSTIDEINLTLIKYDRTNFSLGISFDKPKDVCCIRGKCSECCILESCRNNPSNFPIIFVHGHDMSKYTSAEYNLDEQNKIQKKLESEGFVNAGAISINSKEEDPGILGEMNAPLTFRVSYYLDTQNNSGEYVEVQTKDEGITDYAVRLKRLIDIVKYKTGKPKVMIVAYSMGGLVSRKYAQIYGDKDIYKLILLATPNNGIYSEIAELCPVIGGKKECEDMNANSTFMRELSTYQLKVPTYTIVGSGCKMINGDGDGVVLVESSKLSWANNSIVKGDCYGQVLHTKLTNPGLYPDAYNLILEVLKEENPESDTS